MIKRRKIKISADRKRFKAELAENFLTRAWGLSLRKNGKMLFKFPRKTRARVDMMLLSKPLHLYFIDSNQKIIDIQKAKPWTLNPKTWKTYRPKQSYQYLLESFEDLELEKGTKLRF